MSLTFFTVQITTLSREYFWIANIRKTPSRNTSLFREPLIFMRFTGILEHFHTFKRKNHKRSTFHNPEGAFSYFQAVIVKSMLLSNNALHLVFIWHFLKLTYFMPGHTDHQSFNHSYVAIVCFLSLFKCSSYAKVPKITFLDEIQPKVLRVFPCYSQSHLYNFALRFLFLLTHATSYSFYSSVTVHCRRKEKNLIENHTPFRNPYRNLKSEI